MESALRISERGIYFGGFCSESFELLNEKLEKENSAVGFGLAVLVFGFWHNEPELFFFGKFDGQNTATIISQKRVGSGFSTVFKLVLQFFVVVLVLFVGVTLYRKVWQGERKWIDAMPFSRTVANVYGWFTGKHRRYAMKNLKMNELKFLE